MSGNSTLQKYADRFADNANAMLAEEGAEDFGSWGLLRGLRDRAEMLELRKKTGNVRAVGYNWIARVDYDPSVGITLWVGEEKICITGRHLNRTGPHPLSLLGGLLRHRVQWIAEADQETVLRADHNAVVVETIGW